MDSPIVLGVGLLVTTAALVLSAAVLRDLLRNRRLSESRLIRRKTLEASLRESIEVETARFARLLGVVPGLYKDEPKPRGESVASEGELEWLDARIPGPLRMHFEDLDFLLELSEFLGHGQPIGNQPTFCRAYYFAGMLAFKYSELGKAVRRFRQLVEFDEDVLQNVGLSRAKALYYLGTAHLFLADEVDKSANLAEGIVRLRASYASVPNPIAGYNLAWALDELGKYDEAISLLHRVLEDSPRLYRARLNLACALAKLSRFKEALEELKQIPTDSLWTEIATDTDLAPLRDGPWKEAFAALIEQRTLPAKKEQEALSRRS